ncbi:MAG: putative bifunctional diguanylate cyclase/phosphodiesterase [Acidimicrobiales bacterium]
MKTAADDPRPLPPVDDDSWYRSLVELSPDAVFVIQDKYHVFANQRGLDLLGAESVEQLRVKPALDYMAPDVREVAEERTEIMEGGGEIDYVHERIVRLDGVVRDIEAAGCSVRFGGRPAALVVVRDISDRVEAEHQLAYQASYDALTDLPNRASFNRQLEQALAEEPRVAVLFCDVDRFKTINDSLGHAAGDRVLRAVADRLSTGIRQGDVLARFGGDEFTILCRDVSDQAHAERLAERLRASLEEPFDLLDGRFHVSASIGIALGGPDADPEAMLRDADAAMYRAKDEGRRRSAVSVPDAVWAARRRLRLESDLRGALSRHELSCHFQPVIGLREQRLEGVETLARWQRSSGVSVPPGEFVAVAESAGFAPELDREILDLAFAQRARWRDEGVRADLLEVSVNVTPDTLDEALPSYIDELADQWAVPMGGLVLEITERQLVDDLHRVRRVLAQLSDRGVKIALDDFGVGYSSLAFLAQLPVDRLKIDRLFVNRLEDDAHDRGAAMLRGIIELGHSIDLAVVAEGVETAFQLDIVTALGCDAAQGFHLSRPVPAEELEIPRWR